MKEELFNDLLESVEEAGAIRRGEQPAEKVSVYKGKVLVEVREQDETVWALGEAAEELQRKHPVESLPLVNPKPKFIRESLRQTQEGFAELLGVSVRTLQNWEQGHRKPQGPSRRLLSVASAHPLEVLDTIQPA
jgi:putative transcriptional regulator